jgi:CubicO group peptidase (beta-lactamase class C family)
MGVAAVVRVSLLGLVVPVVVASQTNDQDLTHRVDHYVAPLVARRDVSGVALIGRGGIILARSYGMANYELGVLVTDTTRFQVGSISKQFTAAAIMLLQQRGSCRRPRNVIGGLRERIDGWRKRANIVVRSPRSQGQPPHIFSASL